MDYLTNLSLSTAALLLLALAIAFAFEFVNGFHDTANAVATVIYTNSLPPVVAVVWSGIFNFLGVLIGAGGGFAVAYSIVHLLPVDLLIETGPAAGLAMVLSLLLAAITWNVATWYLGIPVSSSHALIGSILGVGLIHGWLSGKALGAGVNWSKASDIGLSLLLSPLFGFGMAALLLLALKKLVPNPALYRSPEGSTPPPFWVRCLLIFTCTGVSFGHGSNDGQKGMGLVMLILIGLVPAHYALNVKHEPERVRRTSAALAEFDARLGATGELEGSAARSNLRQTIAMLAGHQSYEELPDGERLDVRMNLLRVQAELHQHVATAKGSPADVAFFQRLLADIRAPIEYVPLWVIVGVALALGIGTMIGWKRIVITVGEKIGKSHLTYAQGASAELVAMSTILLADFGGLPVSTTQVLSSGVAGTMVANGSGVQASTLRNIILAWLFTLPATMLLAMLFFTVSKVFLDG